MSDERLTCHVAGEIASKELPQKFLRLELETIKGYTPKRSAKIASWSAELLNYYFSLAMVKQNPAVAVCLMAEAGVSDDCIEYALKRAGTAKNGEEFKVIDTRIAIAPPTFSDDVNEWLNRGYEVDQKLRLGDVCVYDGLVGLYHKASDDGITIMSGFIPGSGGKAVADERLLKVLRV